MSSDDIAARFASDTVGHSLTVLHDNGLYRHIRLKKPDTSTYWFDLITWPWNLVIRGDMGTYQFSREEDMFPFFRGRVGHVNPDYWAEKTPGGRAACKSYSEDQFRRLVAEHLADAEQDWPGVTAAWAEWFADDDAAHEEGARAALDNFDYRPDPAKRDRFHFSDTWEWDLHAYDWQYLWCCHAIQWGIAAYDAQRTAGAA